MVANASGATDNAVPLLLGALCLVILLVSLLRRWHLRSATARDLTREQRARLREQREVGQSLEELLSQLEEAASRIDAQLDARSAKIEALLRAADERLERTLPLDTGDNRLARRAPDDRSTERSMPAGPGGQQTRDDPPPSSGTLCAQRKRILELAAAGTTPLAIADALHLPIGEVELVLNLRKYERGGTGAATSSSASRGPMLQ